MGTISARRKSRVNSRDLRAAGGIESLRVVSSDRAGGSRFPGAPDQPRAVLHNEPDRPCDVIERIQRVRQPEPGPVAESRGECDPGAITQPIAPPLLCAQVKAAQLGAVT